jgi:hypothetical protein
MPTDLVLIPRREKTVLAATTIEDAICNKREINPEYENVLSKTYPSKTRNNVTPRSMQS